MTEDSPTMFAGAGAGARPDERRAPSPRAGRRWSRACRSRVLLTSLGIALLAPAPALAVPDGGVELVDRPTGFGELPFDGAAGAAVGPHAISADGCQVVMESDNDVLLALDDDRGRDIVRVDRCAPGQPAVLVSATAAGVPADGAAFGPTISADGTRVAFVTDAPNLLPPGSGPYPAIVVKDLASGEVTVASRDHGAGGTVRGSVEATISGDGRAVAFISESPVDAVNADGTTRDELYVRYLGDGATVMASANGAAGGGARAFDISRDGRRVALVTDAKLTSNDTDLDRDAYLTTVTPAGSVAHRLASRSSTHDAAISSDGTWIAYAGNRVWFTACPATDPCALPAQADNAPDGALQDIRGLGFPRSTAGPTHVFWTTDRDLLPADANGVRDLYASTLLASELSLPFGAPAAGATGGDITDGAGVAIASSSSLDLPGTDGLRPQVLARAGGTTTLLSQPAGIPARRTLAGDTTVGAGAVSDNGRVVAMETGSAALGASLLPGNFARTPRVVVRDVVAGVTTVAGGDLAADRGTRAPSVDRAGTRVAFESFSATPTKGLAPTDPHVHVHDLATGATQLVDRLADGTPVRDGARYASISEDGTKVAFTSSSPDLPGGGTYEHAYVADLGSGAIAPVDVRKDGIPGDKSAREVVLDADGSRVAFVSSAGNLGGGAGSGDKVYLKDLETGEITYLSVPESGTPDQYARDLSIDAAGTRVTWTELSPQFGYGSDGHFHVFLRDLAAGTTRIVSRGGDPAGDGEAGAELDSAGGRVVFSSWDRSGRRTWLRDLAADAPVALGRLHGETPGGAGISPDGTCVALTSNATGLTPEPVGPDFAHVYLRAAGGECAPRPAGGPGDGGAGGAADTAAPVLSGLRMTRTRFAVARAATPRAARLRRGSAFAFSLSEDARTSIAIARARPGRRAGGRCVRPRGATGPRCTRFAVVATLTRAGTRQGANRIAFSGRLGRRALPAGRYRATVGAVDAAGNRAAPRRVRFRIAGASR